MWDKLASFILRKRVTFIILIAAFTAVMGFFASKVQLSYDGQKLVPNDDPEFIAYTAFKKTFGEDGNKLVIGIQNENFWKLEQFNKFRKLTEDLGKTEGVMDVVSPAKIFNLTLDTTEGKFALTQLFNSNITTQAELDSFKTIFIGLKFYENLLYNKNSNVALILVSIKDATLNSEKRTEVINSIRQIADAYGKSNNIEMHYSGLPYVRHEFGTSVRGEIVLFTIIAFAVTALLIFFFFRSLSTLAISMIFIAIGVVTMLAVSAILGFKLTLISGTLPPLLVVIGVQNTIYLINQYHDEYRKHGNKAKALSRIISKVGVATFLINFTTAIGFGTFYFTKTLMLEQYGIVSFVTINIIFFVNIIGIPVLYSFLPAPSDKQVSHLENKTINNFLSWVKYSAFNRKRRIYFWHTAIMFFAVAAIVLIGLKPLAFMVDDIPHSTKLYKDLEFFQKHFNGVMPFEIVVTSQDEGGVRNAEMLNAAKGLQKDLKGNSELSKPMSLVELVSFANQAYNEGDEQFYRLPKNTELGEIISRIPTPQSGKRSIISGLVDTTYTKMRISYQMHDIGSIRMDSLVKNVRELALKRFPSPEYKVDITGTSAIFLKGNSYLYSSLISSTLWALLIISLTMGLLFPSFKMIIISVIPNVIPLFITAGLMAYFHIPLKPSTILVFSIAFGITIDATIHFMSTFRRYLMVGNKTLREALSETIMEVGVSMMYTMVALFAGFLIFVFSGFQGTQSLGWLTAVTLFTGLLANLFLLPALILSFEKGLNVKEEFKETVLELPEED